MEHSEVKSKNSFLDQDNFRKLFLSLGLDNTMKFHVAGIRCSNCVRKLESLPQSVEGLVSVRVNLGENLAEVRISSPTGSFGRVVDAMEDLGYRPEPISNTSNEMELVNKENRSDLIRLAVVGACAGNIMTFSFANYFGLQGLGAQYMNLLNLVLFLPVVFYGAIPFYRGFWYSLKTKKLSIDAPMVVAFSAGSVFSVWSLFLGKDLVYFDSLSGFLFLILLSRWTQKKMQSHFLSRVRNFGLSAGLKVKKITGLKGQEKTEIFPANQLRLGDKIEMNVDDILVADSILLSPIAQFDASFLSGESLPRVYTQGMKVPAGCKVIDDMALFEVCDSPENSEFGKLVREVQSGVFHKVKVLNLADKVSQILLAVVFCVALTFLIFYWHIDSDQAIARSLALIILACPCAMAFGTPLALSFSLKNALDKGILIKSADVFEKVNQVKSIFLDKTGTLTSTKLRVTHTIPAIFRNDLRLIILGLERPSHHPVAFAIREYLNFQTHQAELSDLVIDDLQEIPGKGVSGLVCGHSFEIKSLNVIGTEKAIGVYRDGVLICHLFLEEELLPHTEKALFQLKELGIKFFLASGDSSSFVKRLGRQLGLDEKYCFSERSPNQKADLLESIPYSMMVGDGINDSLALKKSFVGVAVKGSVEIALRTADVYFFNKGIAGLPDLFSLSNKAHRLIQRNLKISLVYNTLGGIGALLGYVNPFVAAILMPISSGFILLSSWLESKK